MSLRSLSCQILLCLGVGGCMLHHAQTAGHHYETIAQDLGQDSDRARRENAAGIECINKGQWDLAEQAFQRALDADVTFGPAHNNLGNVYYHQGRYYLAAWEFQYAIKLMPYQAQPHNNLGLVFEQVGKLDEAIAHYDEALALDGNNPQIVGNDARARLRRGDRNDQLLDLLNRLVMNDTRPQWVDWAKEHLVLLRAASATAPSP